jgi:hypothetical protein
MPAEVFDCAAMRPIEQLQLIFGYSNAHTFPDWVFIPGIGCFPQNFPAVQSVKLNLSITRRRVDL